MIEEEYVVVVEVEITQKFSYNLDSTTEEEYVVDKEVMQEIHSCVNKSLLWSPLDLAWVVGRNGFYPPHPGSIPNK
jgi:hypothetical protein